MDCDGKFRNPIRSMKIIRQISDFLCAERGLSIVENPQPSRGSYRDWQDKKEPLTNRDKLTGLIDSHLSAGMTFKQFIGAMAAAGCEVKRGKYLSIKIPGAERFIRVKSLGDDYTEKRQKEITEIQKHIGNYGKTRDVYLKYKRSGRSEDFLEIHRAEIIRHEGAKRYFDELGLDKIPPINTLKQEWAKLDVERRKLHSGYKIAKERFMSICTAEANADVILFDERQAKKSYNKDAR
jgi:hypothetical protein